MDRATLVEETMSQTNEIDFNTSYAVYGSPIAKTKDETIEELNQVALPLGDSVKTVIEDYKGIVADTEEQAIDAYYKQSVNEAAPSQLTAMGIEKAWSDPKINQGNPGILVSRVNQSNPMDDSGPQSLIDTMTITETQLQEKINYAQQQNPDRPSALVVGNGVHWAMLAIDPTSKEYRYVDSYNSDMDAGLKAKLDKVLGAEYKEITIKTPDPQQKDETSCGYWVIKNAQTISQQGIRAAMYYNPSEEERNKEIGDFSVKVQEKLVKATLQSMAKAALEHTLRLETRTMAMKTGINIVEANQISNPGTTHVAKRTILGRL